MQIRTLLAGSAMLALLAGCASGPTDQGSQTAPAVSAEQSYQGTLPCRNCSGINLNVTLRGNERDAAAMRTYDFRAEYLGHPKNPPADTSSGNWSVLAGSADDPQATVYELTPNDGGQIYYLLRLDPQTLELIDMQRRRFQNRDELRLKRQ